LDEVRVFGAPYKGIDPVQRVGAATAGDWITRFGPLVDHREREAQLGGHLLGTALLKDFPQEFV
jgi:hypothetical protein